MYQDTTTQLLSSESFTFILYDNLEILYSNSNINLVIHELLSYIKHTITFLKNNNVPLTGINFDNFKIVEQLKDYNKRFPYTKATFYFNPKNCEIENLQDYYSLSEINENILLDIKHLYSGNFTISQTFIKIPDKSQTITTNKKDNNEDKIEELLVKTINIMKDVNTDINIIPNMEKVKKDKKVLVIDDNSNNSENSEFRYIHSESEDEESEFRYIHSESEDEESDEIKKKIELLEKLKHEQEEEIRKARENIIKKKEEIAKEFCELSWEESVLKKEKEKEEIQKRIFESDTKIYYKIKDKMVNNKDEEEIPILFRSKYPVFEFMNKKNILEEENSHDIYKMLTEALYLKDEEEFDINRNNIDEEYGMELVIEFLNSLDTTKKYKSYDEIMMELNEEDEDKMFEKNDNYKEVNKKEEIDVEEHREKLKRLARLIE